MVERGKNQIGVIIFGSVRFLFIKTIKLKFKKIQKIKLNQNQFKSTCFDLVILY